MKTTAAFLITVLSFQVFGANYKYNELMTKDYDEMSAMVENFVQKSRDAVGEEETPSSAIEAVGHLKEALKLILSRPDSDNMVAKLMAELRRELMSYNAFENALSELADEALATVKNPNAAPSVQSTSLFILENTLSQIRPEVVNNGSEPLKAVMERVAKAKIEISKDVYKDRKLRGMFKNKNPSEIADEILKSLKKKKKK